MKRFQFSLSWLVWATFICALLAAALRWISGPSLLSLPLAAVPAIWALYAIFRLPYLFGSLRRHARQWAEIRRRRAHLAQWADEQRCAGRSQTAKADAEVQPPATDGRLS